MADLLRCTNCTFANTPAGGRVFASASGGAFHARTCAEYRAEHGIPDDAPGVRVAAEREAVTLDNILALMAAPASAPVAPAPAAEEVVVIDGVTYRKA